MTNSDILGKVLARVKGRAMRQISEMNILSFNVLQGRLAGNNLTDKIEEINSSLVSSSAPSALMEKMPTTSLLLDIGELHLCSGNREEAAKYANLSRDAMKSLPVIYASNPPAMLCKLSLLEAKLGSEVKALDDAYDLLDGLPRRAPPVNEGYRSVAMTAADCLHLGARKEPMLPLIERSIEKIRTEDERQDTLGHVIRKLCMRNDTQQAHDTALIATAEAMMSGLSDQMERVFTTTQLGLARALADDLDGARKHFAACNGLVTSRSPEGLKYTCHSNLFRAYAQAGLSSEADELGKKLVREFDEIVSEGENTTSMIEKEEEFLGRRLPRELREMSEQLLETIDAYTTMIASSFISAAWSPTRANDAFVGECLATGRRMIEKMSPGYSKFSHYLLLSSAHATRGKSDDTVGVLRAAVDELKSADRKTARALFSEDFGFACSRAYFYNEGKFVDLFLEYAEKFGVRGRSLSDGCYEFCSNLAALARDRKWQLTFYLHV